ncbi:MAG: WbuC family cupin fold metalloprotein, partial [Alphaproteobacteria bacterium]|nr:WbuC family cupin fold metalloprotein [Alphaproteobacteria bacterium]
SAAAETPLRRARICAHPSMDHDQHDMLIASHRETYVAPHRHRAKSETLVVIEGEAILVMFDEDGTMSTAKHLAPFPDSGVFFYRMPEGRFHSLVIRSDFLVFVESTKGPFHREDSENALWAPAPDDHAGGKRFREEMARQAAALIGS